MHRLPVLPRLASSLCAQCVPTLRLPALAERPLQGEAAEALQRGDCELEGVLQRARVDADTTRDRGLGLQCGFGWRSPAGPGIGWSKAGSERGRSAGLGGKTQLWATEDEGTPAFPLAWGIGADRIDGHWRRSGHFLNAVASVGAGPGSLHANLGHAREREARRTLTTRNLAWECDGWAIAGLTLAPMAAVFGDDRGDARWNLEARLTLVPDRFFVDASYGRQTTAGKARLLHPGLRAGVLIPQGASGVTCRRSASVRTRPGSAPPTLRWTPSTASRA